MERFTMVGIIIRNIRTAGYLRISKKRSISFYIIINNITSIHGLLGMCQTFLAEKSRHLSGKDDCVYIYGFGNIQD